MAPETKTLVAGRYKLGERLGSGGIGTVWRAADTLLERQVAIKQIDVPGHLSDDERETVKQRVLREARAAARLNHSNAVTVYDVIQEEGRAYIVMEMVDAPTLGELVARGGPLPIHIAATMGLELLDALETAHAHGIIHRDVKPANVMVPSGGFVKLADFGIASVQDDPKITSTGTIIGSPAYMAPEQALGRRASEKTDLWALGATLYYAIEGEPPFQRGGKAIPTLAAVVHDEPRIPRRSGSLGALLTALLSKDPDRRPDLAAARAELERVARKTATDPTPSLPSSPQDVVDLREPEPSPDPIGSQPAPRPGATSSRGLGIPILAVVTVLLVGVGVWALSRPDPAGEESATGRRSNTPRRRETPSSVVPAEWKTYVDPEVGYTIAYPPGWQVVDEGGSITDFEDPSSRAYLRVDWTSDPGPSPEGAWYDYEKTYAPDHPGYQRVRIEPMTFKGMDAALWEWTWNDGGTTLHAIDLGFTNPSYGFALNFVAPETAWASSQDEFAAFKASFVMPNN